MIFQNLRSKFQASSCVTSGDLPFKDEVFECVYAFNVLEHVSEYDKAISELNRVSSGEVLIRFDKIFNLANWLTSDHESLTVQNALSPFPKPVKWLVKIVRFPIDHSNTFQGIVHGTFPLLRKLGLLDRWNYHRIK